MPNTVQSSGTDSTSEVLERSKAEKFYLLAVRFFTFGEVLDYKTFVEKQKQKSTTADRERIDRRFVKVVIREFIIHVAFIICLSVCAYAYREEETPLKYKKIFSGTFVEEKVEQAGVHFNLFYDFTGMTTIGDVWGFLELPLIEGLYEEEDKIKERSHLVGRPRLRQQRVKENFGCVITVDFQTEIKECFPEYLDANADVEPFGLLKVKKLLDGQQPSNDPPPQTDLTAWNYTEIDGGESGFIQDLPPMGKDAAQAAEKILAEMKQHNWMDRATRHLFVDFSVYNPNLKYFNVIQLKVDFHPTGRITSENSLIVVKLPASGDSAGEVFVLIFYLIFFVFTFVTFVQEMSKLLKFKLEYFKIFFNWFDLAIMVLSVAVVGLKINFRASIESMADVKNAQKDFVDIQGIAQAVEAFDTCLAFLILVSWVKFFKFVSFHPMISTLAVTLKRSSKDLGGFFIMFFIIFMAFCQLAYLVFGHSVEEFANIGDTFFTQLRLILGDFDYSSIEVVHRVLAPLYFFSFIFFIFFVLMNMFIAIICDHYSEVKQDVAEDPASMVDFDLPTYLAEHVRLPNFRRSAAPPPDIQTAVEEFRASAEDPDDSESLRLHLRRLGFSEPEITSYLQTSEYVYGELGDAGDAGEGGSSGGGSGESAPGSSRGRIRFKDEEEELMKPVTDEEFKVLTDRIGDLEKTLRSLTSSVEAVLKQLRL